MDRPRPARRRHGPGAGDGRGAEGRQRSPRHRDEPRPGRPTLLFQKVMRHNPANPDWRRPRPVRALLRPHQHHPLHPALPRRLRPRARGPQGAAHLGQQDPGPPRARPHRRRRDHHRPARPGRRQRGRHGDGGPARARPPRPRGSPRREPLRPPRLRDLQRRRPAGGRERRGLLARRPPAARQPDADLRRQQDLDRGRHRHRVHRGRLGALRAPTAGTSRTSTGPTAARRTSRTSRRCGRRSRRPAGHRQAKLHQPPHDHRLARAQRAGHRQGPRLRPGRRRGRRHQGGARLRPRARPSRSTDEVLAHTRGLVERGRAAEAAWQERFDAWAARYRKRAELLDRMRTRSLPDRLGRRAAHLRRRRQGGRHPEGVR